MKPRSQLLCGVIIAGKLFIEKTEGNHVKEFGILKTENTADSFEPSNYRIRKTGTANHCGLVPS